MLDLFAKHAFKPKLRKLRNNVNEPNHDLKVGIWIYFFLLLFEGALRKWVLPALSTPLLIVRDPVAFWLLIVSIRRGILSFNLYLSGMIVLGVLGIFTAILFGHGSIPVAVYGARILVLHFPLIFIIGRIFNKDDVLKMGRMMLIISVPMALLITLQFYSPQSAWVNKSVSGGDEGAGFSGALGYFRPPGTFSFINGTTQFFGLLAPFVFYFWLNPHNKIHKILLIAATLSLLSAMPLSISRTLFFSVLVSGIFAVIAITRKPQYVGRMLAVIFLGLISLIVLSQAKFFQTATAAFTTRFEGANETEGGVKGVVGDRYFGSLLSGFTHSDDQPFWGYGMGIGTSVGGSLLSGKAQLQLGEYEWGRLIGEMGLLMGACVILLRLGISLKIARAAYRKLMSGDLLPWMLLSFCLLNLPQGQWGQPTSLGFGILIGGLNIASLRNPAIKLKNKRYSTYHAA